MLRVLAVILAFFVVGLLLILISAETGGPLETAQGGADFPVPAVPPPTLTPMLPLPNCVVERLNNRYELIIGNVADLSLS